MVLFAPAIPLSSRAATFSANVNLANFQTLLFASNTKEEFYLQLTGQPTITLSPGDTVSGTILFQNSQQIKITDTSGSYDNMVSFQLSTPGTKSTNWHTTTTLIGLSGQLSSSNPQTVNSINGSSFIGSVDHLQIGATTGTYVSFTGFSYTITLDSITGTDQTPINYTPSFIIIDGMPNQIFVVPEPSGLGMFLAGLLGVGLAGRRHRSRA